MAAHRPSRTASFCGAYTMGSVPNCSYIGATLCPGSTGPSPLWVNKALLSGKFLGTGGSFAYDGACYSVPANAQPQKPSGGGYASAGYMGRVSSGCSDCCAVTPASVEFDCSGTGTNTVDVTGPANATIYLYWSNCWLIVNGIGPAAGGGNTSITLGSGGTGTFTVGISGADCQIPCPGGPAVIEVGTTINGGECGSVAVFVGCPPCPGSPTSLTAAITVPTYNSSNLDKLCTCSGSSSYGCATQNTAEIQMNVTLSPNFSGPYGGCAWYGSAATGQQPPTVAVSASCYVCTGSGPYSGGAYSPGSRNCNLNPNYGLTVGNAYWVVKIFGVSNTIPPLWGCCCAPTPPTPCSACSEAIGDFIGFFPYNGPVPSLSGTVPPEKPYPYSEENAVALGDGGYCLWSKGCHYCPFTGGSASISIT